MSQSLGVFAVLNATKGESFNVFALCVLFGATAWLSRATLTPYTLDSSKASNWNPLMWLGISDTLAALGFLQGLLAAMSVGLLFQSFEIIGWILAKRDSGVRTLRLLGVSSMTGLSGGTGLIFSPYTNIVDKLLITAKLILFAMAWLSGIVLFARTNITTVNKTVSTYNVTAGVGIFRGAYVSEFLDQLAKTNVVPEGNPTFNKTILPYSIITTASQLTLNSRHVISVNPVACRNLTECNSYLLAGGLSSAKPWATTDHEDYPIITIHDAPAAQLDYQRIWDQDNTFNEAEDCRTFGADGFLVGMKFCLAENPSEANSLLGTLYVCPQGVVNGECLPNPQNDSLPHLSTSLRAYQRHATVTSARGNMSISSIQHLSEPMQQVNLNVSALLQAFTWMFDSTASGIPVPSSVAQYFWAVQDQLASEYWSEEAYQFFLSLLSFPFWHFNDNNYGNIRLQPTEMIESLPQEFYTFASVDKPMSRISVDPTMYVIFLTFQGVTILFVIAALIARCAYHHNFPTTSSYPVFDFMLKTEQRQCTKSTAAGGIAMLSKGDHVGTDSGSKEIVKALSGERTVLRRDTAGLATVLGTVGMGPVGNVGGYALGGVDGKMPVCSNSPFDMEMHSPMAPQQRRRNGSGGDGAGAGYSAL